MRYECVEKTVLCAENKLLRICEGRSRQISCPAPKKIDIISANYGRLTGRHLCPGTVRTTNCGAAGSIDKVRSKCQGRQSCSLQATNSQFGDPCVGTKKYLEVTMVLCVTWDILYPLQRKLSSEKNIRGVSLPRKRWFIMTQTGISLYGIRFHTATIPSFPPSPELSYSKKSDRENICVNILFRLESYLISMGSSILFPKLDLT